MASQNDANTVYLTEQEAERIRNTVKDRIEKCSKLAGNTREPRDAKAATSEAYGTALMADMGGGADPATKGQNKLPAIAVGQVYPPSIVSVQDLESMKIAELKMDTHHHGKILAVKRVSPVVTYTARSWTVVEDEEGGETERLEVCLHKLRHSEEVMELASTFLIKEPYFTFNDQGEATIWIDHPSDLIVCTDENAKSSPVLTNGMNGHTEEALATAEKFAATCKNKGNAALKEKDLPEAHAEYTKGLKLARQEMVFNANPDLARDIARNRAHVNLLLSRLDEAITDAKASLIGKDDERSRELDSKAYYRAACAAYNLGGYQEAKGFFEQQKKLMPDNKDAGINLRRIELRLREQENGGHNLNKIRAGLSRARPGVDAASFIKNTEVKDSPGRGRGLFASRDVPAGGIILCEKAFCVVWGHEREALTAMTYDVRDENIRVSPVGLSRAIVQKLLKNPSQIEKVMDMYGDYQGDGKNVASTEDGPVVDAFRIQDIVSRNAFSAGNQYGEEGASSASTGLWIWSAYMNHSCIANCKKEVTGDLLMFRALRPITAGEELFASYDESGDYDARQAALMHTWGFECKCALCAAEKGDDPEARKKRRELAAQVDDFVGSTGWMNAKRLTIAKAQRLARAIDETYDAERYGGLARKSTETIQQWLSMASPRR